MTKSDNISRDDIAETIHQEFGFSRKECLEFVNDIIEIIIEGLKDKKNDKFDNNGNFKNRLVKIHNFGTFILRKKKSRIGRNPKTKKEVMISNREVVTFKASKNLLRHINNHKNDEKIS